MEGSSQVVHVAFSSQLSSNLTAWYSRLLCIVHLPEEKSTEGGLHNKCTFITFWFCWKMFGSTNVSSFIFPFLWQVQNWEGFHFVMPLYRIKKWLVQVFLFTLYHNDNFSVFQVIWFQWMFTNFYWKKWENFRIIKASITLTRSKLLISSATNHVQWFSGSDTRRYYLIWFLIGGWDKTQRPRMWARLLPLGFLREN